MKKNRKKLSAAVLSLALVLTLIPAASGMAYADDDDFRISNVSSLEKVSGLKTKDRDDSEIDLKWNAVEGASGYEVQRYSVKDGKWIRLGYSDDCDFEVEDLLSASVYSFRARAFARQADGDVIYGSWSKTYKTSTRPKDVDNLRSSSKTTSSITLKWNSVKRADGYQVYIYDQALGQWERLINTGKTTYKATGLDSSTSYTFRVRPYRNALDSRYYGEYEKVTVKTTSSGSSSSSGLIGESRAKEIALKNAGVSASAAEFLKVELDYDDGVRVYEIEFEAGDFEYEYEINAKSGSIRDFDRDSRWD